MTFINFDTLVDFVASLSVLGFLVVGFRALGCTIEQNRYSPIVLGTLFGLVADLQMSMPLSPMEGVIFDMRNVPVVLAGAFLGLRGLAICLAITIGTRIGVGGIGMMAGVGGILISGAVGYAWSQLHHRLKHPDWVKLALLGVALNLHMLSALLAPETIAIWFYTKVAPTALLLNLMSVPLIGALFIRERNFAALHATLSAGAQLDPATRLMPVCAFANEIAHYNSANIGTKIVGVGAITIKNAGWLARTWGDGAVDQALGAMRIRVAALCGDQRPLGLDSKKRILVPVTEAQIQDPRPFREALRRLASEDACRLSRNVEVPISVIIEHFNLRQPNNPKTTLADIQRATGARRSAPAEKARPAAPNNTASDTPLPAGLNNATIARLFDQVDANMKPVT